jgi:hypothetical protein
MSNVVKGISYYHQNILTKAAILFFGKNCIEKDDLFTYEGKTYKGVFYYMKQYMNK